MYFQTYSSVIIKVSSFQKYTTTSRQLTKLFRVLEGLAHLTVEVFCIPGSKCYIWHWMEAKGTKVRKQLIGKSQSIFL